METQHETWQNKSTGKLILVRPSEHYAGIVVVRYIESGRETTLRRESLEQRFTRIINQD